MTKRILLAIVAIGIIGAIIYYAEQFSFKKQNVFYPYLTYTNKTFRPYDTKFVYEQLKKTKRKAFVENEVSLDENNNNLADTNKVMMIVSPYFLPNELEVSHLNGFVTRGNNVFISSFSISPLFFEGIVGDSLDRYEFFNNFPNIIKRDSLTLTWNNYDTDKEEEVYTYPGINPTSKIDTSLEKYDSSTFGLFAKDSANVNQLLDIKLGKGHVFILRKPISMSNYFLLHKQNYKYLNRIIEVTEADKRVVVWDNFYQKYAEKRPEPSNEPGESYFLKVINKHPPLLWAIISFFLAIGLFILINSRRLQEPIPVIPEIQNHSIGFVKAVSGLYWVQQDHKNIAEKIKMQFYDFMTTNYKIPHKEIVLENVERIAQKTNKKQNDIENIIYQITDIEASEQITKQSLMEFYTRVYKFIN
jgi:hypothetical protein